jgi:hypothetical protein
MVLFYRPRHDDFHEDLQEQDRRIDIVLGPRVFLQISYSIGWAYPMTERLPGWKDPTTRFGKGMRQRHNRIPVYLRGRVRLPKHSPPILMCKSGTLGNGQICADEAKWVRNGP